MVTENQNVVEDLDAYYAANQPARDENAPSAAGFEQFVLGFQAEPAMDTTTDTQRVNNRGQKKFQLVKYYQGTNKDGELFIGRDFYSGLVEGQKFPSKLSTAQALLFDLNALGVKFREVQTTDDSVADFAANMTATYGHSVIRSTKLVDFLATWRDETSTMKAKYVRPVTLVRNLTPAEDVQVQNSYEEWLEQRTNGVQL